MQHPFQRIAAVQGGTEHGHLIAACGPRLISLSLESGELISEWTADSDLPSGINGQSKDDPISQSSEPPSKRQKTSNDDTPAEENKQQPSFGKKTKQQKKNASPQKSSTFILLAVSPDQHHLAAVTDDKSIRIFALPTLQEIGKPREVPKRPCAIQIPPSNDTLLLADKHGDVYSLPLIQGEVTTKPKPEASEENKFKPSATPLTVHSKRNLTALQAQQAQKQFTPRKDVLAEFDNTLLLGHVSMLTDMTFLSLPGEKRQWLATCDRDEHIRISRAPPQAHVIEGFCLGHQAFVSRICQVGRRLVSGGGDAWLGVWDFQTMTLERKIQLEGLVPEGKMAVSGIWQAGEGVVFVMEKVDAVFYLPTLEGEQDVKSWSTSGLYPLDVAILGNKVVVSVDAREGNSARIQVIDLKTGGQDIASMEKLKGMNSYSGKVFDGTGKQLDDLLYNVANLRKRGPMEGGEPVEEEGATLVEEE